MRKDMPRGGFWGKGSRRGRKKAGGIALLLIACLCLPGCEKKFMDYECAWVCGEPYICIATDSHRAYLEIDGEIREFDGAWGCDGASIYLYDIFLEGSLTEDALVWEAECEIKKGRLYLTVVKDHVSQCQGRTFVLKQRPLVAEKEAKLYAKPTGSYVFYSSRNSIAELTACTEGEECSGTAIFTDDMGTFVTNAHIALREEKGSFRPYETYKVYSETEDVFYLAQLVKYDMDLDIAVLRLEEEDSNFTEIEISGKDSVQFGDSVYLVENVAPYGLSMKEGIVSCPQAEAEYGGVLRDTILCGANLASDNSGGALLDESGGILGIMSYRARDAEGNLLPGLSHAIPIQKVIEYADEED